MKLLIMKAFVLCLRMIYAPMKLRGTQNKILWLSRQSDVKSGDMIMLEEELKKQSPETVQVFRLRKLKDEKSFSIAYAFSLIGDMWEMASAKVVITDTYSVAVSCLEHKESLQTIQMWHALGAVKKFGLQSTGKSFGRGRDVSKALHMHENYDHVFAPSKATASFYCKAFGCSKDVIRILALPRVDSILDGRNRRDEFLKLNPCYKGKKIVTYIPTFRDNDELYAEEIFKAFENCRDLGVVISAHPLSKTTESGKYTVNGEFNSEALMKLSDAVITDYSACAFEAAILKKPLYFYIPDYDEYKAAQGLNIDVEKELPECSFRESGALVSTISNDNYDFNLLESFGDKYVENKFNNNTERMARFVCSLLID